MKHLPHQCADTRERIVGGAALATVMLVALAQPATAQSFTADDIEVSEGSNASFEIKLPQSYTFDIRWDYATADDTATSSDDYTAAAAGSKVTFNAGDTSRTVGVATLTDCEAEDDETFDLALSNFQTRGYAPHHGLWTSDYTFNELPTSKTITATIKEVAPAPDC